MLFSEYLLWKNKLKLLIKILLKKYILKLVLGFIENTNFCFGIVDYDRDDIVRRIKEILDWFIGDSLIRKYFW